jgi:anti-anti-sigma factor
MLDAHTRLVAPTGELDVATNPAFRTAVKDAADAGGRVVVDLSGVSFMSAEALGVLARADAAMDDQGGELVVVCPSPRLLRLFDITGLTDKLLIVESHESGLARG